MEARGAGGYTLGERIAGGSALVVDLDPGCPACRDIADWRESHPGMVTAVPDLLIVSSNDPGTRRRHPHIVPAPNPKGTLT